MTPFHIDATSRKDLSWHTRYCFSLFCPFQPLTLSRGRPRISSSTSGDRNMSEAVHNYSEVTSPAQHGESLPLRLSKITVHMWNVRKKLWSAARGEGVRVQDKAPHGWWLHSALPIKDIPQHRGFRTISRFITSTILYSDKISKTRKNFELNFKKA